MSHHLRESAEAKLCHDLPQLLGNEEHEVHDILRFALEALAQALVLGGNAHRAGVQIADTHHHAAHGHKRSGGKAELLSAKQGGDGHIPAAHELAVCLDDYTASQVVLDQRLVCLRKAQLPGKSRVMDGALGRSSCTSVVAGDEHNLGACLGHAGGDGADASLGHQLDSDPGLSIGVLQVIDKLRQILDGVDIVVRRRGDQRHAWGRVAGLCDPGVYLLTGQMSAFSGLCALGHFNLDLFCAHQIFAGDAKAPGGHLLDGAVFLCPKALRLLAALA